VQKLRNLFLVITLLLTLNCFAFDAVSKEKAIEESLEEVDEITNDYIFFPASDLELGRTSNAPVTPTNKVQKNHHSFENAVLILASGSCIYNNTYFKLSTHPEKKYLQFIYPTLNFW
jgi:hypothetical protein